MLQTFLEQISEYGGSVGDDTIDYGGGGGVKT
jgi:hypothetical protein